MGQSEAYVPPPKTAHEHAVAFYDYSPREGQSDNFITIPKAILQEVRDSIPNDGDAKALLTRALNIGRNHPRD